MVLTRRSVYIYLFAMVVVATGAVATLGQSSEIGFPTAITSNSLQGMVKARSIGDNRVTTYYFAFDGEVGDIFINVVARNLDGDIDIFAADGMRPLTKMVVYSDTNVSETGD